MSTWTELIQLGRRGVLTVVKRKHIFFKIAQIWHLCFRFGAPGQSQQAQPELHGEDGAAGGGEPTGQV